MRNKVEFYHFSGPECTNTFKVTFGNDEAKMMRRLYRMYIHNTPANIHISNGSKDSDAPDVLLSSDTNPSDPKSAASPDNSRTWYR